jgi:PleD family two-component response regulator
MLAWAGRNAATGGLFAHTVMFSKPRSHSRDRVCFPWTGSRDADDREPWSSFVAWQRGKSSDEGPAFPLKFMASVLIVHSDDTTETWAASLRAKGFAVHRVCNPEEAFSYIAEHPPAVIVTDSQFRLSAFNGTSFISAVRGHKACALSRIIVCSKQRRADDERHVPAAGADLFLGPSDLGNLPQHLTHLLSQRRRARQS